jgi:hypothetical protein
MKDDTRSQRQQHDLRKTPITNRIAVATPPTPTDWQVEKLRLILSTYQDGSGMLASSKKMVLPTGMTLPGWRDFERAVAAAFGGIAQESKNIFDVVIKETEYPHSTYGISCKMRGELDRIINSKRDGRVTMELSNSAKKFWTRLETEGIYQESNYREKPTEAGVALVKVVRSWHEIESRAKDGKIDLNKSSYLALSWNKKGEYQLHQFSLDLPDPSTLHWYFPTKKTKKGEQPADRLCGNDETGTVFEWYGTSGGQLKYYPLAKTALWASDTFRLEPLPSLEDMEYGILAKAKIYFPMKWHES